MSGHRWRPQYAGAGYVPDFYCPAVKLVIDLDGPQHSLPGNAEYDRARTAYIDARGCHVIRFRNAGVMDDTASVLDRIESEIRRLAPSANPLRPHNTQAESWGEGEPCSFAPGAHAHP